MLTDPTRPLKKHPRRLRGFTLIELLVVIAILALLMSLLLPSLRKAILMTRHTACATNQRNLAVALSLYATEFDEQIPLGHIHWQLQWNYVLYSKYEGIVMLGALYTSKIEQREAAFYCPLATVNGLKGAIRQGSSPWPPKSKTAEHTLGGYVTRPTKGLDSAGKIDLSWAWSNYWKDTGASPSTQPPSLPRISRLGAITALSDVVSTPTQINAHLLPINTARLDGSVSSTPLAPLTTLMKSANTIDKINNPAMLKVWETFDER